LRSQEVRKIFSFFSQKGGYSPDEAFSHVPEGDGVKKGLERATAWLFPLVRHKMTIVMLGGALGTAARFGLSRWIASHPWAQVFPYGTLIINVSGSFILGLVAVLVYERLPPGNEDWFLLIGTGFCGGYTTFSTFEWETFKLVRDGSTWLALANVVGSVVAGFVGVLLAVMLVGAVFPKR
jgi:CrcB protein